MAEFNDDDFYPILASSIREDIVVPFDCFILLQNLGRIVRWVPSGEVFPALKLEKLRSHKVSRLYVHINDKALYFAYLQEFFETDEGKAVYKELKEEEKDHPIEGLPDEDEFQFKALDDEEDDDSSKVQSEDDDDNFGNVDVTREDAETSTQIVDDAEEGFSSVDVQGDHDPLGKVVRFLQKNVEDLATKLNKNSTASDDEATVIRDATLEIKDQLEELLDLDGSAPEEEVARIKNVTEKISEALMRVKGRFDPEDESFDVLYGSVKKFEETINEMQNLANDEEYSEDSASEIQSLAQKLSWQVEELGDSLEADDSDGAPEKVIESSMTEMIEGLEEMIGAKIYIDQQGPSHIPANILQQMEELVEKANSFNDEIPSLDASRLSDLHPLYTPLFDQVHQVYGEFQGINNHSAAPTQVFKEDGPESSPPIEHTDSAQMQYMKNMIERQTSVIKGLEEKMSTTRTIFTSIKEKWFLFQVNAKKRMEAQDLMALNEIDKTFKNFSHNYQDSSKASESLNEISDELCQTFELDKAKIQAEEFTSAESHQDETHQALDASDNEEAKQEENLMARLSSENEVLKVQLENAQSLIETSNIKISELEAIHTKSDDYTKTLESENADLRKQIQAVEEKVGGFESQEDKYHEAVANADRSLHQNKLDISSREEQTKKLQDQVQFLESEIEVFRKKFSEICEGQFSGTDELKRVVENLDPSKIPVSKEYAALLSDREELIKKQTRELSKKTEALQAERKKTINLTSSMQSTEQKVKTVAHRHEKLRSEHEVLKKANRSQEMKHQVSANLLKEARKTISKLTAVSEELRKDRQKYLRKTNESLASYKDMMNQAMSLNKKLEADEQKIHSLEQQYTKVKEKSDEISEKYRTLAVHVGTITEENKKLKNELSSLQGSASATQVEAIEQRLQLSEKKVEELKAENKKLMSDFVQEQRRAETISKESKALQIKLTRAEALAKKSAA